MTNEAMQALAEKLVVYGRKKGASEIEVIVREGSEFTANVREQAVENLTEAGSRGLSLRALVEGKTATAGSSDLSEDALTRLVDNAVARAQMAGKDAFAGLPELETVTARVEELGMFDPRILELTPEAKIDTAKKLETTGLSLDKRVNKSLGSTFRTYEGRTILVNSKGFTGSFKRTFAVSGVGFQGGEGENLIQDYWYEVATGLDRLPGADEIAGKAVKRVARLLGARKVETQNVPLVMEPPLTGQFLEFLANCVGGQSIARRQSFLVDKLGQKVGNDLVTIVDDGLMPGGQGTVPFDSEGVPSRTTPVIEKGVLKNYLLDTYYGRKLKLASTGNASGATNFFWKAGESTPEQIIKSVDRGLYITNTIGLGTVPTTGDWSVGAYGLWIEKGELAFPVAEITISANIGELLQSVEMVGRDLEFHGSVNGPTVKFAEVTVGGKAAG